MITKSKTLSAVTSGNSNQHFKFNNFAFSFEDLAFWKRICNTAQQVFIDIVL